MTTSPRDALDRLVAALEAHYDAVTRRTGEADPAVIAAYTTLADAFETYDNALYDTFDEVTPFELVPDDEDEDDEDDEDEDEDDDDLDVLDDEIDDLDEDDDEDQDEDDDEDQDEDDDEDGDDASIRDDASVRDDARDGDAGAVGNGQKRSG